jgi:nucleoside-diphosphate-sugar epimerase
MPTLLLFGGSRMLGPHVLAAALEGKWEVTVANRGSEPAGGYPAGVAHVAVDRGDRAGIAALLQSPPDAIVDLSCYEPGWAELTLEALSGWGGTYLLMSSGAVYPETDVVPVAEDTPPRGRALWGEYGAKKVEIERLFRESAISSRTVIVRPPYIVDESDFMERLPFVFERIAAGVPVLVPDSGKACIQLVAAEDVAVASVRLLTAQLGEERVFNVGPPRFVTLTSLVQLCARALGADPAEVELVPLAEVGLSDRPYSWDDCFFPFADQHYVLDAKRLDRAIGYRAYESLEHIVDRLAGSYQSNPANREPAEAPSEIRAREKRGLPGLTTKRSAHA